MKDFLASHPDYQKMSVVKKDKQSVHFLKPDGKIEANFSSGPINYQDDKGNWQPIDPTLKEQGDEIVGSGTPALFKKNGTVVMKDNPTHTYQITSYGWYNPATKQFTPIINQLPQGQIEDTKYVRKTQEFKHELIMLDNGLKENLILYSPPSTTPLSNSYFTIQTKVEGLDLPDGELGEYSFQGLTFPAPKCRDGEGKEIGCTRFAQKINNQQYIYTGFLKSWLTTAAYPVIIDPDFIGNATDKEIWGYSLNSRDEARSSPSGETTTGPRTAVGLNFVDTSYFDDYSQEWVYSYEWYTSRGYVSFDTSSIGSCSSVTQVNFKSAIETLPSSNFDVDLIKQTWLGQAMWQAYTGTLTSAIDAIWLNTSGKSTNTVYTSPNLSTSWINKTGSTEYSLASDYDYDNVDSGGVFWIYTQEETNVSYRPVLTVLYDATATPTPSSAPTPTPVNTTIDGNTTINGNTTTGN